MSRFKRIRYLIIFPLLLLAVLRVRAAEVSADPGNIILIGDSRAQGMHEAVGDAGIYWCYSVGKGYDWMVRDGVPAIEQYITNDTAVVITLGVNDVLDTFRIPEYADYLNAKASEWSRLGAHTYYVSITPVDDQLDKYEHNSDIEYWNAVISGMLSSDVTYLDLYTALGSNFATVDGLHYNYETCREIFNLIMSAVNTYQTPAVVYEAQTYEEDDSLVPQMRMTAADTEDDESQTYGAYSWEEIDGSLYCVDHSGSKQSGVCVIGKMVCVFDSDGELIFSFRR